MSLTDEVKSLASDLVGIASIDRYEGSPEHLHPQGLLPQTRSVISIAIPHIMGVLVPQKNRVENFPYQTYGYGWLSNIRLNFVAFELSRFLERQGHITCPYPSFFQGSGAAISNRHAAMLAGLSRFGWSNLAMTPEYGTKQRFVTVMTAAELEPDPILTEDICDKCFKCVDACPMGAISRDEEISYEIAGQTIHMAKLDKGKCCACHAGDGTWFKKANPVFVTFSDGGHCGLCLIHCPKGARQMDLDA